MIHLRPNGSFATALGALIFWAALAGLAYWAYVEFVDTNAFRIFGGA